jgi:hypothetical protein
MTSSRPGVEQVGTGRRDISARYPYLCDASNCSMIGLFS